MAFSGTAPLLNYSGFPTVLPVRFILKLANQYSDNKWILKDFSQELKIHKAFLGCLGRVIQHATPDLRVGSPSPTVSIEITFLKKSIKYIKCFTMTVKYNVKYAVFIP